MSNEVTIKEGESFLPQTTGEQLSIEDVKEELDGAFLSFPRVTVDGESFIVDDGVNQTKKRELDCIIVYKHRNIVAFDEDTKEILCKSNDEVTCTDMKTGQEYKVEECPHKEQQKQKRDLYILEPGDLLPKILSLPITSAIKLDKWVGSLLGKGIRPSTSIVKIGIERMSKDNYKWSQVTFERIGTMTPSDVEAVKPLAALAQEYANRKINVKIEGDLDGDITPVGKDETLPF